MSKNSSDEGAVRAGEAVANGAGEQTDNTTTGLYLGRTGSDLLSDDDEADDDGEPLSAEQFQYVLHAVDELGLTWTSDLPPGVKAKNRESAHALDSEQFQNIQVQFPRFPYELGHVILCVLTGRQPAPEMVGDPQEFEQKAQAVRELLISPELRSDFFFQHMLKVPYFLDLDWEVNVKMRERGVQGAPVTSYALVSLLTRNSVHRLDKTETFAFALDEQRVGTLIDLLVEVREALIRTQSAADTLLSKQEDTKESV